MANFKLLHTEVGQSSIFVRVLVVLLLSLGPQTLIAIEFNVTDVQIAMGLDQSQ